MMTERVLALGRMGAEMCRADTEGEALGAAGRHLHEIFGAGWVGVGKHTGGDQRLQLTALQSDSELQMVDADFSTGELVLDEVVAFGAPLEDLDLSTSRFAELAHLSGHGMRNALAVPLKSGGSTIGSLILARSSGRRFDDEDRLLAVQASSLMTSAVVNLRSLADVRRAEEARERAEKHLAGRASEFDLMQRLLTPPMEANLGELAERVASGFTSLPEIALCRISEVDTDGSVRLIASVADGGARFADADRVGLASSPEGVAVTTRQTALWRSPAPSDRVALQVLRFVGVSSLFAVPLRGRSGLVGVLTAASVGPDHLVTDEQVTMAGIVGRTLVPGLSQNVEYLRQRRRRALEPAGELMARLRD